ncbi:charged multivesicular body protein 7 isoform X3 [Populus alba x Populus x berolinensis]|nr:charged multivesicular body protein 7 isoform X3 [Populus alba x Populus x berolinensis]
MDSVSSVKEFIRKQVPDWDDEIMATARFKAFSGQRSDWEPKYFFWKDLILKIARHLDLFIIQPSQVKEEWFNRGGLTPLCLDHVLDKTARIIKCLSESHWTSSCIITMSKFQGMCGGPSEAAPLLSYLSGLGKAQYFSISKEVIEGVKISLSSASVPAISSLDLDVLHLISTAQKLEDQIDVIDRRYEMSRKSALASLNSGNKKVALRHAREMKLASESRERCTSLLNRVEEVLNVIANAESTQKVTEAIRIGAEAMKRNKITVEEVEHCLEELEESIDAQKQVEKALESNPISGIEDEDIEEELEKLELELESENLKISKVEVGNTSGEMDALGSTDSLTDALSNLKLHDGSARESASQKSPLPTRTKNSKHAMLEAA